MNDKSLVGIGLAQPNACKGSDGAVVLVAIDEGTTAATVPLTIAGRTGRAMLTPHVTSGMDESAAKTRVAVSRGAFMASLPNESVTTFVGR